MALKRKGEGHAQFLLRGPQASALTTYEDAWDFPQDYRPALESEYVRQRHIGENRIVFFIRFTASEFHKLRYERWRTAEEDVPQLQIVRKLHNEAVDRLTSLRERDRQRRLYSHINLPTVKWNIPDDHPQAIAAKNDPDLISGY